MTKQNRPRRSASPSRSVPPSRVAAGALAALLFGGLTYLLVSPGYRVAGAGILGNARVSSATIYAASELDGRSVFAADVHAASERIMALPDVSSASVAVRLPHHVSITVDETDVLLVWRSGESSIAIEENGRAIAPPAALAYDSVPTIVDLSQRPLIEGDVVAPDVLAAALAYAPAFGSLAWDGAGFTSEGPGGWQIRLGADASLAEYQKAVLDGLVQRASDGQVASIGLVDLRFRNRSYVRADRGAGGQR